LARATGFARFICRLALMSDANRNGTAGTDIKDR
jgi:hypothetical protein